MENVTCELLTATEITIDNNNKLHPAGAGSQDSIIRPEIYIVRRLDGTIYCLNADAAWTHARAAMKADMLVSFDIEIGDNIYQYEQEKHCFVFDCKMNPTEMRYEVHYWMNDESGFVKCATFAEAKEKADEEYGSVYAVGGQSIYFKREPDAYDAYWDAL